MHVGIDLGTTNSALAFTGGGDEVLDFGVPQLVAAGETVARPLLPSFIYLPAGPELPAGALALPWDRERSFAVGELARAQGALVPGRLVSSAKSWLCHPGVDREAAILPWGAPPDVPRMSPVEASARILTHLREAWDVARPDARLATLEVVLTVPASFDEVARELTVAAAHRAGLDRVTLLEEPLAAFYAWLERSQKSTPEGLVLVCDIGGGTTDFTLIRSRGGTLEREAVGDHLLLGGDNIDLALARSVEARMGTRLDARQLAMLVQQCRQAKEKLLTDDAPERVTVVVAGRGTRVIGGQRTAELTRDEVHQLVVEGFFPPAAVDEEPARARAALYEFGLPYAADPAVTRHLAQFLRQSGGVQPDAVLFNGGTLAAPALRQRILDVLTDWRGGTRPIVLEDRTPELAVARGAAYYGVVRQGRGVRVGGGAPRSYYVETELHGGESAAVCLIPKGTDEGAELTLPQTFMLRVNSPARFRLLSSSRRGADRVGVLAPLTELEPLPPIFTALRLEGTSRDQLMPVGLVARLTEIGTIELHCVARDREGRWRLAFDLRGSTAPSGEEPSSEAAAASDEETDYGPAIDLIRRCFRPAPGEEPEAPDRLVKDLEAALGAPRDKWSITALRALWEPLRDGRGERGRTAAHEARWMNLAGYALRPGFGYVLDEWRIKELWRVWVAGLVNEARDECRVEQWITWRRVSGGLRRNQQHEVARRLMPFLLPEGHFRGRKPGPQELSEMWRCVASMERISPAEKTELGKQLIERVERGKLDAAAWFALGRLGARVPLYGPADAVVPAATAQSWAEPILKAGFKNDQSAFALTELARCSGDRARDLEEPFRRRVADKLKSMGADRLARMVLQPTALEAREEKFAFGDALPAGLRLVTPDSQ